MNLSVVSAGHVHTDALESLTQHLTRLEQVVTNLPGHVRFSETRAELNRAIDAAANDWILLLREREIVDPGLAEDIARALGGTAWGYRIRTAAIYNGKVLRLGDAGELRLFHRRHLLRRGELMVEGPVVRMQNPLRVMSFASPAEHRAYLARHAVPHSTLRRVLLFLRNARTLDANTLRYVWIEAGYDHA